MTQVSEPVFETDTWVIYKPQSFKEYSQHCDTITQNSFDFYVRSGGVYVFKGKLNSEYYSMIWNEEPILLDSKGNAIELCGFTIANPEINNFIQGLRQQ